MLPHKIRSVREPEIRDPVVDYVNGYGIAIAGRRCVLAVKLDPSQAEKLDGDLRHPWEVMFVPRF